MKHIIGIFFVFGVICARPQHVIITSNENLNDELGNFKYSFQIDNTIAQQQKVYPQSMPINFHIINGLYSLYEPENTVRYIYGLLPITLSTPKQLVFYEPPKLESYKGISVKRSQQVSESEIESSQPQTVLNPVLINVADIAVQNNTNITVNEEFPDRVGTPAIITLQGSYG